MTMIADDRKSHLHMVVDRVLKVRDEWAGSEAGYITQAWEEAMDDLSSVYAEGDIPGECRPLATQVNLLVCCWQEWWERNQRAGVPQDKVPIPGAKFWGAVEAVRDARERAKPRPAKRIESVASLRALQPPVSDQQICRMYGWKDENGQAETWKIEDELKNPGCHSTLDPNWAPPHEKRRQEAETAQKAAIARTRRTLEQKLERLTTPAPESIETLVKQGVSAKQIALMHKISIDEVLAHCDEHGIQRPVEQYADANHSSGQYDVTPETEQFIDKTTAQEQIPEPPSEPMTLEAEIIMYHQQGLTATDIAAAVSRENAPISYQKVNQVIKRWKADPAAVEV